MATWKADELTDDVQAHEAVSVDEPARNVAPDVAGKARRVAVLVNAVEGPTGRAVGIELDPRPPVAGPCRERVLHLGGATPVDGRHHRGGAGSGRLRQEHPNC